MGLFKSWEFSCALREKRQVKDRIDIRSCADLIGISAPTLSRLENCKTPDIETFALCCKWLQLPLEMFFEINGLGEHKKPDK